MIKFCFISALINIGVIICSLIAPIHCFAAIVQKAKYNLISRDSALKNSTQHFVAFDTTSTLQSLSDQDLWVLNHPLDSVTVDSLPLYKSTNYPQEKVVYPRSAAFNNIDGTVVLRVLIDKEGNVIKIIVVKSDSDILTESAVLPVKKSKFQPATLQGKPIYHWFSCPIIFRLVR